MTAPAGGDQGAGNGLASLPSPLDAVDDLRSAAKWTIAAAGVVGAALISGGPLVAVGQVHGAAHALLAGAGLVVALIGVGLSIWSTSTVLSPQLTTPATLRSTELAKLRAILEEDPAQFFGPVARKIDTLLLHREVAVNLARLVHHEEDSAKRAKLQNKLEQAERNAKRAAPYVRWLLALGHAWQIKQALERSRWFTLAGGILVIAGAVLFFLATGSNGPTYVPVLTPSPTTATETATPTTSPAATASSGAVNRNAHTRTRPHTLAVVRSVVAEPGSGHYAVADLQSHRVVQIRSAMIEPLLAGRSGNPGPY